MRRSGEWPGREEWKGRGACVFVGGEGEERVRIRNEHQLWRNLNAPLDYAKEGRGEGRNREEDKEYNIIVGERENQRERERE